MKECKFVITPLGSDNKTVLKTETLFIDIDEHIQLAIDMDSVELSVRVYPITKGEYWDMPHEDFTVNMGEIEQLEKEMEE